MMLLVSTLVAVTTAAATPLTTKTWVEGEMGYRVSLVPPGSPGARHQLRVGDILAEPAVLPDRLRGSGPQGVDIPLYRLNTSTAIYERSTIRIVFNDGEEKRLGLTGDLGFLVTAVQPDSLGARAELKAGDFIPKIDDTFVHADDDLKVVDAAYDKSEPVLINFVRWYPETAEFKNAVSRRRFVK